MNIDYINELISKFLDAETTLEEERELYSFFSQPEIPEPLQQYKDMFLALSAVDEMDRGLVDDTAETKVIPLTASKHRSLKWSIGIAASIVCIAIGSLVAYMVPDLRADYAVAYVDGHRIDDDAVALQMGTDALSEIFCNSDNAAADVSDIFNNEE